MSDKGGKPPKGTAPSGVRTQGGGGDVVIDPSGVRTQGGGGDVTNQQILVLDSSILHHLSAAELRALKLVQLEFARSVSAAAAAAYGELLALFSKQPEGGSGDGGKPARGKPG